MYRIVYRKSVLPMMVGFFISFLGFSVSAWACEDLKNAGRSAFEVADVQALKTMFLQAQTRGDCNGNMVAWLHQALAVATVKEVAANRRAGGSLDAVEGLMRDVVTSGVRDWRLEAWLGDLALERGDFTEAASWFFKSLDEMKARENDKASPDPKVFMAIHEKWQTANLAADGYVEKPSSRSSASGSMSAPTYRGIQVKKTMLPLEFETGTAVLTDRGRRTFKDLLYMVMSSKPKKILIIGHTDPRGGDLYNEALSLKRAKEIGNLLRHAGYEGEIRVDGRGEREPLNRLAQYTEDQFFQVLRRVEVQL